MAQKRANTVNAKKGAAKRQASPDVVSDTVTATPLPPHTPEFVADLTEVFKRHGWAGLPREISFSTDSICQRVCDDGSIAQPVTLHCPGGMSKIVCACPGEDPTCED